MVLSPDSFAAFLRNNMDKIVGENGIDSREAMILVRQLEELACCDLCANKKFWRGGELGMDMQMEMKESGMFSCVEVPVMPATGEAARVQLRCAVGGQVSRGRQRVLTVGLRAVKAQ